ncbi:MAG: type II toxin-antitoxin system RelE/ParE family toxin [Planctomycetales bacterium]|nr:type II toxin-antitoxin system RelE/ParE family toxin [Planctomycetales bacterium]
MRELIFAPSARRDLSNIFDSIARDKPFAAANWIDKIEEKCPLIARYNTIHYSGSDPNRRDPNRRQLAAYFFRLGR